MVSCQPPSPWRKFQVASAGPALLQSGDILWTRGYLCACVCGLQAVLEKASIDEVYMDVTALVDNELQARPMQSPFLWAPAASLHCSWRNSAMKQDK